MSVGVDFRYFAKLVSTARETLSKAVERTLKIQKRTPDWRYQNGANDASWLILIHWLLTSVFKALHSQTGLMTCRLAALHMALKTPIN